MRRDIPRRWSPLETAADTEHGDTMPVNALFAWTWILAGLLIGAVIGLFFHNEEWLGGYASWRRRMVRLGHISFLGTGFLNLVYSLTVAAWPGMASPWGGAAALIVGGVTMPTVCFLAAWRKGFRHLFFVPVGSLLWGTGLVVWQGVMS